MANKDQIYTDEVIKAIGVKVAKDLLKESDEMQKHILLEILEAWDRDEDVYSGLAEALTRPFMERFIDELLKYEE